MRKSLLIFSVGGLFIGGSAQADTLLGVYAGANAWNMETSGGFAESTNLLNFNFADETQSNYYVALEHPLPLVPNIKLSRTQMDTAGSVSLTETFTFGGEIFSVNTDLFSSVEMSNTDVIMYYELFDNDLISFDFGINAKYIDGKILVRDVADTDGTKVGAEEFSGVVPMLYSRLAVGFPFSGWGAYAEGSYLSVDDHTLSDYQAAITYRMIDNVAIDMTFQLGYRSMALELKDLDGIYSDLEFKGAFAGLEVHF